MSDQLELDPEVVADLKLREATLRDPTRTRRDPTTRWDPPKIIGQWPCRNQACRKPVDVTADAVEYFDMFNRMLAARGELPLESSLTVACTECRRLLEDHRAVRNRDRREELRDAIKQLKASKNPPTEHDLIKRITKLGHPDVPGLLQALAERTAKKRAPRHEDM